MITKKLDIKKPCGQNWNEMKPMQQGRYCGSCNHIIHDFSEMSNDELLQMLQSGKHSCGRFVKEQMGMIYMARQQPDRKKYWAGIAAAIIAGVIQLNTGYSQAPVVPKQHVLGIQTNKPIDNTSLQSTIEQTTIDTLLKKEKFSFRIVDAETKKPLEYVRIEMRGISGVTDSMGRIDLELTDALKQGTRLDIKLFQSQYEEQKAETDVNACLNRLNILYMTRKKLNQNKEYVVGFW